MSRQSKTTFKQGQWHAYSWHFENEVVGSVLGQQAKHFIGNKVSSITCVKQFYVSWRGLISIKISNKYLSWINIKEDIMDVGPH